VLVSCRNYETTVLLETMSKFTSPIKLDGDAESDVQVSRQPRSTHQLHNASVTCRRSSSRDWQQCNLSKPKSSASNRMSTQNSPSAPRCLSSDMHTVQPLFIVPDALHYITASVSSILHDGFCKIYICVWNGFWIVFLLSMKLIKNYRNK